MATSSNRQTNDRVISLIDMDCFYVQVEEVAAPEYANKPCGVSQYTPARNGGLIAVNYEARKFGVKRGMRIEEAKAICPEFHAFFVNGKRGKADLTKYREASLKIFEIITKHCPTVEKASIDEAYIDLTEKARDYIRESALINEKIDLYDSFVLGDYSSLMSSEDSRVANLSGWLDSIKNDLANDSSHQVLLYAGAILTQKIREDIFSTLGYHCSAGVAHNKTLAKYICGMNKPNKQTVLPIDAIETVYKTTPIQKIKNLGGKLGVILTERMELRTMNDLACLSLQDLIRKFGDKTGNWLHQISRGIDNEPVLARQTAKSIGCSKNFRGKQILDTCAKVQHWIKQLCEELEERLEAERIANKREPTLLVIHLTNQAGTFSKSTSFAGQMNVTKQCSQILETIALFNKATKSHKDLWLPAIQTLGLSATKFVDTSESNGKTLLNYFSNTSTNLQADNENETISTSTATTTTMSSTEPHSSSMNASNGNADDTLNEIEDESPNEGSKSEAASNGANKRNILEDFVAQHGNKYEEIDYVRCEKCNKKVLCWEMAEHEDFHFAQELSLQMASNDEASRGAANSLGNSTTTNSLKTQKRLSNDENNTNLIKLSKKFKSTINERRQPVLTLHSYFNKTKEEQKKE